MSEFIAWLSSVAESENLAIPDMKILESKFAEPNVSFKHKKGFKKTDHRLALHNTESNSNSTEGTKLDNQ